MLLKFIAPLLLIVGCSRSTNEDYQIPIDKNLSNSVRDLQSRTGLKVFDAEESLFNQLWKERRLISKDTNLSANEFHPNCSFSLISEKGDRVTRFTFEINKNTEECLNYFKLIQPSLPAKFMSDAGVDANNQIDFLRKLGISSEEKNLLTFYLDEQQTIKGEIYVTSDSQELNFRFEKVSR